MQVFFYGRIDIFHGLQVAVVTIIVPQTETTERKALLWEFLVPFSRRNGSIKHRILLLPVGKLTGALAYELRSRKRHGIRHFCQFIGNIADILCPFAVGAIHEIIAHGNIKRALCLSPEFVERFVAAVKASVERAIVTCFTICETNDFYSLGNCIYNDMSVNPSRKLVFLFPCFCLIFVSHHVIGA